MWIVFGWDKEERPVAKVANAYCYGCRRKTLWIMWNESEWVTFSAIRTLRFINLHRLQSASCTFFPRAQRRGSRCNQATHQDATFDRRHRAP